MTWSGVSSQDHGVSLELLRVDYSLNVIILLRERSVNANPLYGNMTHLPDVDPAHRVVFVRIILK